jgi:atypical dual specificity phosphatase
MFSMRTAMADLTWNLIAGPAMRPAGRPSVSEILSGLLIGEYPNPDDIDWLQREHRVSAVLSLQDDADLLSKCLAIEDLRRGYASQGVEFHRVGVPDCDTAELQRRLDEIVGLLDDLLGRGRRVYLHCNAGMNRAPTVAAAFLHARRGMPLAAAVALVKSRRPCVPYVRALEVHYGGCGEER